MKKTITLLVMGTGLMIGALTCGILYANNSDIKRCDSCNKSSCTAKTTPLQKEQVFVIR